MPSQDALVVASYGRTFSIRSDSGEAHGARVKGRRLRPVCGDRVEIEPIDNEPEKLIVAVHPRNNELARTDTRGRREVLLANIDVLVVVLAEPPNADWFVVDRYLCAAELMPVDAIIVSNKADLAQSSAHREALSVYAAIGYPVLRVSALDAATLAPLAALLAGRVAALVGLSGVGKSSIVNGLSADEPLPVGAVSSKSGEGRHTTVTAEMLRLPSGGAIIDSPGVRDYAPSLADTDNPALGYREIADAAANCRYANCRHLREPGCAVKACVDSNRIDERRYKSYRRLVNLQRQLAEKRGPERSSR